MVRIILFALLALIVSSSCSISKRQHFSGYHVDLHPALKKGLTKSERQKTRHPGRALRPESLKTIQPIAPPSPVLSASLDTDFSLSQSPLRNTSLKKSEPALLETDKLNRAALLNQQDYLILAAEKPNPQIPAADPKTHQGFFIASGILAILCGVFYAILINTVASSPAYLFLTLFSFFGLYIGIILLLIALLISLILYAIYLSQKG